MRAFACISAVSLALAPAAGAAPPQRVASLNLCTDELLLLIADPRQIASVTHLAQNKAETPLWRMARRFEMNDGSLLSVAARKPDLIITMGGGIRDRSGIAGRLGIKLLDLPFPQSLDDVDRSVSQVAKALGRGERGSQIRRRISLLRQAQPASRLDSIWLSGGGQSLGAQSLGAEWMRLAGLRQRPLKGDRVSLEAVLVRPPSMLVRSDYRSGQASANARWLAHPLARRALERRSVRTDGRVWTCMGPLMVPEIERLRRAVAK
jgi:iron complex transport system substrate-binding protein